MVQHIADAALSALGITAGLVLGLVIVAATLAEAISSALPI